MLKHNYPPTVNCHDTTYKIYSYNYNYKKLMNKNILRNFRFNTPLEHGNISIIGQF